MLSSEKTGVSRISRFFKSGVSGNGLPWVYCLSPCAVDGVYNGIHIEVALGGGGGALCVGGGPFCGGNVGDGVKRVGDCAGYLHCRAGMHSLCISTTTHCLGSARPQHTMHTASSAKRTWRACLSASLYTATVPMPKRLAVRIIRKAISPRLATRILEKRGGCCVEVDVWDA